MADSSASSTGSVRDELLEQRKRYMRALNNSHSCRHHLDFLTKCSKDHLTPKGLRLHLKVNVIGSNHSELDRNIDTVLKTAESDILTLIADHYKAQGDEYHREANTLKQRMESLAGKLPDKERQQHNQTSPREELRLGPVSRRPPG